MSGTTRPTPSTGCTTVSGARVSANACSGQPETPVPTGEPPTPHDEASDQAGRERGADRLAPRRDATACSSSPTL